MPSVKESWLNDESQQPRILRDLRSYIEDRKMAPQTQMSEDVRNMKAVLDKLVLDESPKQSPESSSSVTETTASPSQSDSQIQAWHDRALKTRQASQYSNETHQGIDRNSWT